MQKFIHGWMNSESSLVDCYLCAEKAKMRKAKEKAKPEREHNFDEHLKSNLLGG